MADVVVKAKARLYDGFTTHCESRGFSFILNGPLSLGGNELGMNPLEVLLSALGASKCLVARVFAEKYGIDLKSVQIDVNGIFDPDGFLGRNKDANIGLSKVTTTYYINANNSEEEVRKLVEFVEKNCPVMDTISNVPEFTVELHCCNLLGEDWPNYPNPHQ